VNQHVPAEVEVVAQLRRGFPDDRSVRAVEPVPLRSRDLCRSGRLLGAAGRPRLEVQELLDGEASGLLGLSDGVDRRVGLHPAR